MKGPKPKTKGPGTPAPAHAVDDHAVELAEYLEACRALFERGTAPDNPRKQEAAEGRAAAFEALMQVLKQGVPVPAWLASAAVSSWGRFQRFEVHTLGEAFGVADQAHTAARRGDLRCGAIALEVERLRGTGLPLKDNANTRGALSAAGDVFNMSAKSVEARVRLWRSLQHNGTKPGATPANGIAYHKAAAVRAEHSRRIGLTVLKSDAADAASQALKIIEAALIELRHKVSPETAGEVMRQIASRMTGPEWNATPAKALFARALRKVW